MNDPAKNQKRFFRIAAYLFVIPLFVTVGCAGMGKTTTKVAGEWSDQAVATVSSSTHINMAPFAKQLVTLVADIQFGLSGVKPVYTRQYLHGPEATEFIASMQEFKRNLARIIAYSGRVISLSRSNLDGPKRAKALADFVDVVRPLEKGNSEIKFAYKDEDIDKILENVRQQPDLLTALQAAQPIVLGASEFLRDRVDELKKNREKVEREVQKEIEADYEDVLTYNETLKRRQRHNFEMINLMVASMEKGDKSALDKVAAADNQLAELLKNHEKGIWANEKPVLLVTKRLELIDKHKRFIAGDLEQFHKVLQELEALTDGSDKALKKAKIAILIWSKAHARLAAGETDPAMFDFMSVAKFAFDLVL